MQAHSDSILDDALTGITHSALSQALLILLLAHDTFTHPLDAHR